MVSQLFAFGLVLAAAKVVVGLGPSPSALPIVVTCPPTNAPSFVLEGQEITPATITCFYFMPNTPVEFTCAYSTKTGGLLAEQDGRCFPEAIVDQAFRRRRAEARAPLPTRPQTGRGVPAEPAKIYMKRRQATPVYDAD